MEKRGTPVQSMFEVSPDLDRNLRSLHQQGKSWVYIARCLGICISTVRRRLRQLGLSRKRCKQETPATEPQRRRDTLNLTLDTQELIFCFIAPDDAVPAENSFVPTPELRQRFQEQLRREIDEAYLESYTAPLYRGPLSDWV